MKNNSDQKYNKNSFYNVPLIEISEQSSEYDRADNISPSKALKMSVKTLSWNSKYILHEKRCEIKRADQILAIAAKPDFFISERDNEDERVAAMRSVAALARQMPPEWCAKARVILRESVDDDCEKCRLHARQAVAALDPGWVSFLGSIFSCLFNEHCA